MSLHWIPHINYWCAWCSSNPRPHPLTTVPRDKLSPIDDNLSCERVVKGWGFGFDERQAHKNKWRVGIRTLQDCEPGFHGIGGVHGTGCHKKKVDWWSPNPPKREIQWAKWEKICIPREEGRIGFRMIHEFNLALLAKQLWRLVQYPDSLVARVLKGRYYIMSSPLRKISVSSPSYVWNSISAARKILLLGIRQKIHSGYEVNVWEDPWIPTIPARPACPLAPVLHPNMSHWPH